MKRLFSALLLAITTSLCTVAQTSLQQSIRFAKDSVTVNESQNGTLQMMADYIKKHPEETIILGGFTSKDTPAAKVSGICEQRAEAVRKKLVEEYGIPATRLVAIGVGISTKYEEAAFNEVVSFFKK